MNEDTVKEQLIQAATVNIFANALRGKNILTLEDSECDELIKRSKEIATKVIE